MHYRAYTIPKTYKQVLAELQVLTNTQEIVKRLRGGYGVQIYIRSPRRSIPRIEASDDFGGAPAPHVPHYHL